MKGVRSFDGARLAAALCLGAAALMAGCAGPLGRDGDLVTDSDESEAHRRARIRTELATAYFAQGQHATALDEVKQAIQADPSFADAYNLRGLAYAALDEEALADESFRQAISLNPRNSSAIHNYAWFLCQRKRFDEADTQFNAAMSVSRDRDGAKSMLAKGVCQARGGKLAEAETTLAQAYQQEPGNPSIALNLAQVLLQRGEAERARFYIRRINAVPEYVNAETLWLAARIEHRLGNRAGAQDFGQQVKRRFPQSAQAAAYDKGQFE